MHTLTTMQRAIALSAASVALTASPALARPDYPLTHVGGQTSAPVAASIDLRSPDAVDAASGRGDVRSPDVVDAATAQAPQTSSLAGTISPPPQVHAVVVTTSDDGIDWGSVGIGAGGIVAIGLIGLAGTLVLHRSRMHPAR